MKTTKSYAKRIDSIINNLYKIQEDMEEALNEYEYYEDNHDGKVLTEKQQEAWEDLQSEYDEIQNAIDYLTDFTSDNF